MRKETVTKAAGYIIMATGDSLKQKLSDLMQRAVLQGHQNTIF